VGNFKIDSIKPLIRQYIAGLPTKDAEENWKDLGIRPPSGVVKKDILKGHDPKSNVFIRFHGKYSYDRMEKSSYQILIRRSEHFID
jgi:zinc protease